MGSKVKGAGKLRRMMKQLPASVSHEIVVELNLEGRETLAQMQARAPRRSGTLAGALRFKVFPKTLRLQVGILGMKENRRLFYARILDQGRRAKTVDAKRAGGGTYKMRVPSIAPMRFVSGQKDGLKQRLGKSLGKIYERALRRASTGGGDD